MGGLRTRCRLVLMAAAFAITGQASCSPQAQSEPSQASEQPKAVQRQPVSGERNETGVNLGEEIALLPGRVTLIESNGVVHAIRLSASDASVKAVSPSVSWAARVARTGGFRREDADTQFVEEEMEFVNGGYEVTMGELRLRVTCLTGPDYSLRYRPHTMRIAPTQRRVIEGTDPGASDVAFFRDGDDLGSTLQGASVSSRGIRRCVPGECVESDNGNRPPGTGDETDIATVRARYLRGAIGDGIVVLLYSKRAFGAVMFSEQKIDEAVPYRWWARLDGVGRLDPKDPDVESGEGVFGDNIPPGMVRFAGFRFDYSAVTEGFGRIRSVNGADCFICVTTRRALDGLDARDSTFVYERDSDGTKWRF